MEDRTLAHPDLSPPTPPCGLGTSELDLVAEEGISPVACVYTSPQRQKLTRVGSMSRLRFRQSPLPWSLLVALVLARSIAADASPSFRGRVVRVIDGDTIEVMHYGRAERVRLQRIDCAERKQAFGSDAKERAAALAAGKTIAVEVRGHDRYGRTLGEVVLPDGQSLNQALVRDGFAWWFRRYSNDPKLARLEAEARAAHRGLWMDKVPVPPWEFRHPP